VTVELLPGLKRAGSSLQGRKSFSESIGWQAESKSDAIGFIIGAYAMPLLWKIDVIAAEAV